MATKKKAAVLEPVENNVELDSTDEGPGIQLAKVDEMLADMVVPQDAEFYLPGEKTDSALVLPDDLTFDQWKLAGHTLRRMEGALRWWVGDWLRFGEDHFKEEFSQEIKEATGLSIKSQQNAMWVAGAIPVERRRTDISWSHHEKIAGIKDTELADKLLESAATNEWTVNEFYGVVREARKQLKSNEPVAIPACICHCHHGQCVECGKPIGMLES